MKDSKLISLLKSLSPEEFRKFEKFADSSYYNMGRDLSSFIKVLKTFYPEFESNDLNSNFIFKKLYKGKKYDSVKSENLIRTFSSHLFRVCKEFLVILEIESRVNTKKYLLLNQLKKKSLYKEFDKEFNSIEENIDHTGKGSVGYFVDKFLISAIKRDCSLNRDDFGKATEYTIKASENIITAALISAYKFEDEKNLFNAYNYSIPENLIQSFLDNINSENLITDLKRKGNNNYRYLEIFKYIYLMNLNKDKREYFYLLKDLLIKNSSIFGQSENYVLWNIMLTYCGINKIDNSEIFQIYKHMIENEIFRLSDKDKFHIVLFRNIVLNSYSTVEIKWLENFIEKYSPYLHKSHIENMRSYSLAYLCYAKSEYGKALEHILNIKYNLFLFKLDLRILQSKIYYELRYFEEGLSLISAILTYLNSTKEFGDFIKKSVGNFAKCLRELILIRTSAKNNEENFFKLKKDIKNISHTNLSKWVEEKIDEITL